MVTIIEFLVDCLVGCIELFVQCIEAFVSILEFLLKSVEEFIEGWNKGTEEKQKKAN